MYPSVEERLHDMQQRMINACKNLPVNHPLQPSMIEPIQSVPVDGDGVVDYTRTDSANIDVSSSHPNSLTQTIQTSEPSIIPDLMNHYSGELPDYVSNQEKAFDIASDEVMTESPHQQTPNQEMASSTDSILIPESDVPDQSVSEQDVFEPDVPELSVPEQVISNQSLATNK